MLASVATHCPYCALQCGIFLSDDADGVTVQPNAHFPVNKGGLCVKGWSSAATLAHADRLRSPLVRTGQGSLAPVSWEVAFDEIADRFDRIRTRHGADAIGVFGGGSLTNEKAYLLGKFARVALRTANIDYNGRFCMSSAAAAATRSFGLDRGLPFPLEDITAADVILLAGGNPAETMPPIMQYFEAQQRNGGQLIVVDPRRSATASWGGRHLRLKPGTDAALANGLLHLLIRDHLIDRDYIATRTEGFEDARRTAMTYWPDRVEAITGVPEAMLVETAQAMGRAARVMILTARGPEQQAQGVNNALAYINVALALGMVGKAHSGWGTLTGQGNGQGGREHGQKADQLPGCRKIEDAADRQYIASLWKIAESDLPRSGKSAFELLDALGRDIHALFVMGSNPIVSAPDALRVGRRFEALDTLVVSDFFLSETAARADIVLPSAQWAEEEGTMTNLEGRVLRRRRLHPPPGDVRTDLQILCGLAARFGQGSRFAFSSEEEVFEELRRATAGATADYSGISYERIEKEPGLFWPCRTGQDGTPRLFVERFPTPSGRARFHSTPHAEVSDSRDADYPLLLTTGRVLAQYQSGTQTRRTPELLAIASEAIAQLHPTAAAHAGIADNDAVVLTTRRGSATFKAQLTRNIREDTIFVPFHWSGEGSANRLTNAALDPISRMPEFKVCAVRIAPAAEQDQT